MNLEPPKPGSDSQKFEMKLKIKQGTEPEYYNKILPNPSKTIPKYFGDM